MVSKKRSLKLTQRLARFLLGNILTLVILKRVENMTIYMMMKRSITVGYYKNLVVEILELNEAGLDVLKIADRLCVAPLTVANVLEMYGVPEGA